MRIASCDIAASAESILTALFLEAMRIVTTQLSAAPEIVAESKVPVLPDGWLLKCLHCPREVLASTSQTYASLARAPFVKGSPVRAAILGG